jgi:hypothetical protein
VSIKEIKPSFKYNCAAIVSIRLSALGNFSSQFMKAWKPKINPER